MATRLGRAATGKADDVAVVALAAASRAFATERPGLYAAFLRAPDASDEAMAIVDAALTGYGLRDDDAIHAIRGPRGLLHGVVALEQGGGFGLPLDPDERFRRSIATVIAGQNRRHGDWPPAEVDQWPRHAIP